MAAMRHPNIVTFMGYCTFPPAIVTGGWAGGWRVQPSAVQCQQGMALLRGHSASLPLALLLAPLQSTALVAR